jgi:hypothetical protein
MIKETDGFTQEVVNTDYGRARLYSAKKLLSNNQLAVIGFLEEQKDKEILYNVSFYISNKRKNIIDDSKCTGNCGLEGLIWAKNKILQFENNVIKNEFRIDYRFRKIKIIIGWADNRRKRVYMWAMVKHGYRYNPTEKIIFKTLTFG